MLKRTYLKTSVGVIIGRFQVPELHEAHTELIQSVCNEHSKVILILGVSPLLGSTNNPLDFESRKQMILEKFPTVTVLYIKDTKYDSIWSQRLDALIEDVITPTQTVTLYGSRDSFISRYSGKFATAELEAKNYVSGTEIRKSIKDKVLPSYDFRAGVIWASFNKFVQTFSTVDVAIFNEEGTKILLGKKSYNDKWQFIGGFSTPTSNSYEDDAKREVFEEANIEIGDLKYVGSCLVADWRYRAEQDKIKTLCFRAKYVFGNPKAGDDISEVKWFELKELEYVLDEMHKPLLNLLFPNGLNKS
jgi:bifunctional NMN adenylyltransferase/nudix hydrolase